MYGIRLFLKVLLLPPASLFLLALVGLAVRARWPRLGRALILVAVAAGYALSTPLVSGGLARALQTDPAIDPDRIPEAGAIVVLSGDSHRSPEYPAPTVGDSTLERIRYAAWLQHRSGLPILVTGGTVRPGKPAVAGLMRDVLERELGATVRWIEQDSRNTWENATGTAAILRDEEIGRILLVTHALHMRRARLAFEAVGFEVVPAPTAFTEPLDFDPRAVLPSAWALRQSAAAFHEWIGLLVYRVAYVPRAAGVADGEAERLRRPTDA